MTDLSAIDDLRARLNRVEEKQIDMIATLAENTVMLRGIAETQEAVVAEIGGAPDPMTRGPRDTVRWRLHRLENDQSAARAAEAALATAEASKANAWTQRQKVALFVFAVIGTVLGVLGFFGFGA